MQSYFKLHVARLILFIPLCGCQRHHRYHSVNGIVGKVMNFLIHLKLTDNAAPRFLPRCFSTLKRHTTRKVCVALQARVVCHGEQERL